MTSAEWKSFLICLSIDVLERLERTQYEQLPSEAINSKWLGFPGASEDDLGQLEYRLGTCLPPSFRHFLQVTNGWLWFDNIINRIWSTKEVEWLNARNQQTIDDWIQSTEAAGMPQIPDAQYLIYGSNQDPAQIRPAYLTTTLEIGAGKNSEFLLLNPQIIDAQGEWEAWFLASWLPGAQRFRSFEEMMTELHRQFVEGSPKLRDI